MPARWRVAYIVENRGSLTEMAVNRAADIGSKTEVSGIESSDRSWIVSHDGESRMATKSKRRAMNFMTLKQEESPRPTTERWDTGFYVTEPHMVTPQSIGPTQTILYISGSSHLDATSLTSDGEIDLIIL